jgi:small conductance mechanosensitive channel
MASKLADSSVNLILGICVNKNDYWPVKFDLTQEIKEEFDRNDIEIPFPSMWCI